jgi:hypothetical protein
LFRKSYKIKFSKILKNIGKNMLRKFSLLCNGLATPSPGPAPGVLSCSTYLLAGEKNQFVWQK